MAKASRRVTRIGNSPWKTIQRSRNSAAGQQCLDALLELAATAFKEAALDEDHVAAGIDQIGSGHALHAERGGRRSGFIEDDWKACRQLRQEFVGVGALLVDVDRNDRQALSAILLLHVVHPRKRAAARSAPGGPEVDVD